MSITKKFTLTASTKPVGYANVGIAIFILSNLLGCPGVNRYLGRGYFPTFVKYINQT